MRQFYLQLPGGYVRLKRGRVTIGRSSRADVHLDDRQVSRIHAVLEVGDETVVLANESKNGVVVNDCPLLDRQVLSHGDRISIASSELMLVDMNEADATTQSTASRDGLAIGMAAFTDEEFIGRTLAGRYTIRGVLGRGGMGRVFAAEQGSLGRTVAIKIVHPHLTHDPQIVARFYTEARAASRLNHPNSVSVIDFGRTDDELLFLAMEYVQGTTLEALLLEKEALTCVRACELCIGVLGALGEAHALGVVHRDVKPANIIIKPLRSGHELVKVVDFGLARILDAPKSTSVTLPGLVAGTPDYMSPQQAMGESLDGRADLYALGVVLFELLTKGLPYPASDVMKVLLRHMKDPIPDPRDRLAGAHIPAELAELVMRALAKSPADRFQDADEFQTALSAVVAQQRARDGARCPKCGAAGPKGMQFCGFCGGSLLEVRATMRPPAPDAIGGSALLIGREDALRALAAMRDQTLSETRRVRIQGETGSGKTRLLDVFLKRAREGGDVVVRSAAHPSRAPVPMFALANLAGQLVGAAVDAQDPLAGLAASLQTRPELSGGFVAAGIRQLREPTGLAASAGAAVDALAIAIAKLAELRLADARTSRIILVVDDLDLCDGCTRSVLDRLPHHAAALPLLIVSAEVLNGRHSADLTLGPLSPSEAAAVLREAQVLSTDKLPTTLPLYLEQLVCLRGMGREASPPPPGTADAIQQRLDRLGVPARRLLHAVAVLGDRCESETLSLMLDDDLLRCLDELSDQGIVTVDGDWVVLCHALLGHIVEASLPAESRRQLHARALQVTAERGAPIEVRASHARRSGEDEGALMLLAAMGTNALNRGDAAAATLAYRWALELARRCMLRTGEESFEFATADAAWRLADALRRSGRLSEADGVASEALERVRDGSTAHVHLLRVRGEVASERGADAEAMSLLIEARATASRIAGAQHLAGSTDESRGAHLRRLGKPLEARDAYLSAADLLPVSEGEASLLSAAEILLDLGNASGAEPLLERANATGQDRARLDALFARHCALLGDVRGARKRYRAALERAERAGDWRHAQDLKAASAEL